LQRLVLVEASGVMGPGVRRDDEDNESAMPQPPSAYDAHQRQRWLRHDAHLWIRHDAARFLPPGADPAEIFPTLKQQREAAEDAAFAAQIEASRRFLAALRVEVDELKAELKRRRLEEAKYSPSQPRVPAGNPGGGQWTDRSGGESQHQSQGTGFAQPMGNVDIGDVSGSSELSDLFQIKPDETPLVGEQIAGERQGGYPVDLLEERELGGHAIEGHVTSRQAVVNAVRDGIDYARRNGDSTADMRESSFTSLEAANKLVNVTISEHPDQVNRVVSGVSPKETLHSEFETPTGFEAYAKNETSRIVLSDTYAVRVVIVPDGRVAKGFRVDTAFPTNLRR
jgi:Bacterial CdiA-CT RNAse A domain